MGLYVGAHLTPGHTLVKSRTSVCLLLNSSTVKTGRPVAQFLNEAIRDKIERGSMHWLGNAHADEHLPIESSRELLSPSPA